MSVLWQQMTHGIPKRQERAGRTMAILLLTGIITLGILGAAYLGLVAANVRISRQVWAMEQDLMEIERHNQALMVECARLSSIPVLQKRSVEMGYQPAPSVDFLFVEEP